VAKRRTGLFQNQGGHRVMRLPIYTSQQKLVRRPSPIEILLPSKYMGVPKVVVPTAISQFPVISRLGAGKYSSSQGGQFGGANDEANAIDADYGTTWDSVFTPAANGAQWYVLDMRTVAPATKSNVWFVWKNWHGNYYEASATLGPTAGSVFTALPRNYKVQGHASAGAQPAVGDAGWVDLVTVTDNRYNHRIHTTLNLSTYNWFRFYCTASSGVTGINDSVQLQFDLRDARGSTDDSIFFHGDSITWEAFSAREPGNSLWAAVGPIENGLSAATSRVAPVVINGGVPGWHSSDGIANKEIYIGGTPCKYVTLNFGSNDANAANIDLNTLGGVNSAYAQQYKTDMQGMIDYAYGLGKICIIPHIPYGDLSAWSAPNVQILNTIIDQLVSSNTGKVIAGPDAYSFFAAHTNCLRDHLHPTYDDGISGGLFNGMTGYENLLALWRDSLISKLYT
jgi:hypothetical protein